MSNMYQSKYSPGKMVREDQYIIELICEQNAKQTNRELPLHFWQLPEWSKFYRSQLRKAKELLSKYSADSILKALRDKRCKKTYSLYGKWLETVIKEYENKKPKNIVPEDDFIIQEDAKFIRKSFENNPLDKLNEY